MTTETINVLNSEQRRFLDTQTQRAREVAQRAAEDALRALAVSEPSRPAYISEQQNKLRLALRDKARQLGDDTSRAGVPLTNLVHDVAYEQWHRLLFARFLEVNGLLRHPEYRDIPLSLEDCGDLASDLGEPDAWAVAARFASEILPGVFRLTDPAVQVGFAAEHRNTLERLLLEIPAEVFTTEDALGWVYQFWQTAEKQRVNQSEAKIGGTDLSPVTQLFTENYMVRFLLENSLGAWWAARHPRSPLVAGWKYLRLNEDGAPSAGSFDEWPERAAELTVIDPCCGSGHFLVEAFQILWRIRAEEEGLSPVEAQNAVLRDNLFGLELDRRCVQIAMFAVVLAAWKQGGGWRELPTPNVGCSGIPVNAQSREWVALANGDRRLEMALETLHVLFRNADTLGSLIDPAKVTGPAGSAAQGSVFDVAWESLAPVLSTALSREAVDPAAAVIGTDAVGMATAADLLSRRYTLVATNPPFLSRGKQSPVLRDACERVAPDTVGDLAVTMPAAWMSRAATLALVTPQNWQEKSTYEDFRRRLLTTWSYRFYARCGNNVWQNQAGKQPFKIPTILSVIEHRSPVDADIAFIDIGDGPVAGKPDLLKTVHVDHVSQSGQLRNPEARILGIEIPVGTPLLGDIADCLQGTSTGDTPRFVYHFWEIPSIQAPWRRWATSSDSLHPYDNRSLIVRWDGEMGVVAAPGSAIRGEEGWSRPGVSVTQMGNLSPSIYDGDRFDTNAAAIVPKNPIDMAALWSFCTSAEFVPTVRALVSSTQVTNGALSLVPFDVEKWRRIAAEQFPNGLPRPATNDPSQWIFSGEVDRSKHPLQVAIARLAGYRWPAQESDPLSDLVDADGIAALVSLPGEPDLPTRLRQFLAASYGSNWTGALERKLVNDAGGKSGRLEDWLRDVFFAEHVRVFDNRPFLWQVWDGRKDGFSAIVNYHKLDRRNLEKLTFTSLGAWIDRQKHEARADRPGADARLAAAEELQRKLKLILDGAPPYDIYVRWKSLAEQPIGWEPDLDDGIRLNIRPFVTADVLRAKVNVRWKKDRGKNPDGSERHNDLHPTLEERRAARREAGAAE
jgi:hypothetical protein